MTPDDTIALQRELERRGPLTDRLRDRVARVGRGIQLGLHHLLPVVVVDMRGHETHAMPKHSYHATIWITAPVEDAMASITALVEHHTPEGTVVTFEVRHAAWWSWYRIVGITRVLVSRWRWRRAGA